ncbi:MAG: hypothetical protein J5944_09580 [Lentisphaeria bacterium]|nr:hypothetical protein [Lentisphaeria bacterium]
MKTVFHSTPEPFRLVRSGSSFTLENRYLRCEHDAELGGALVSAVVKNGTGHNLFAAPQQFIVGIHDEGSYHCYHASKADAVAGERDGNPLLEFRSGFEDDSGRILPGLHLRLTVEYTPWGTADFRAELKADHRIDDIGVVQISTLYPAPRMNCMTLQDSISESPSAVGSNRVKSWLTLKPDPHPAYHTCHLPLSMLVFQRGVEGFQFFLGDDLSQWESIGGWLPGLQMGYVAWNEKRKSYEIRFAPLDSPRSGQYLESTMPFDFRIAFPFVREKMVPLSPCSGNLFRSGRGFDHRWPAEDDFRKMEEAGVTLMRLHNDGDGADNGIFWRDGAYPPYPPEQMAAMDTALEAAERHHICVVPYFSLHEIHPEAEDFGKNAQVWYREALPGLGMIPNYCARHGLFGYQMCLKSAWYEKRINSIETPLKNHAFRGVYYDWCYGKECFNKEHGPHHWDNGDLSRLLEWSWEKSGPEGAVYLHLTDAPHLPGENLASLILTDENGGSMIFPEMFSPHAHLMNVVPRQVCCMISQKAPEADHIRYALCALLHHATVSLCTDPYLAFYTRYKDIMAETEEYSHHTAPGEGLCTTTQKNAGASCYWNDSGEFMMFLVNLAEEPQTVTAQFRHGTIQISRSAEVPPLSLTVIRGREA